MRPILAFVTLLLVCPLAQARDIDGIMIPDTLTLAGESQPLILNGAGYRKKFIIKVYIGALYLTQPSDQAEKILDSSAPRVMRMVFLRDIGQDQFSTAWNESIVPNHTELEMQALRARVEQLSVLIGSVRDKDVLRIEMLANGDTEVWVNDKLRGSIRGVDFQRAVLTAWIGAKPADNGLKRAVLGGKD